MMDYIIKVRALIDSLISVGDTLADIDKTDFVCDGLGLEYRPFMFLIHSQEIIFEKFIHLVIREDAFSQASFSIQLQI